MVEECVTLEICVPHPGYTPPAEVKTNRSSSDEGCASTYFKDVCTTYYYDDFSGGGGTGGSTGGDPGGGNTGGGSGGNIGGGWTADPCATPPSGSSARMPCESDPGWEPYVGSGETWFNSKIPYDISLSLLDPCPQAIAQSVVSLQNSTIQIIKNVFNESTKFNLNFTQDPSLPVAGRANPTPNFYRGVSGSIGAFAYLDVQISLNSNYLYSGTKLAVAQTMMHEMIHAYFHYRSIDAANDPFKQQLLAEELGFLKPYNPNANIAEYGNQHEQMAANFIHQMKTALQEYKFINDSDLSNIRNIFTNLSTDEFYEAMAWAGLQGTKAWQTLQEKDPAKTHKILFIIQAELQALPAYRVTHEKC
jgi:hypothetical protein